MKAKDLTAEQQEKFTDTFYSLLSCGDDLDSPLPWGCPWLYAEDMELQGATVAEMAKNYFELTKEEIFEAIKTESDAMQEFLEQQ